MKAATAVTTATTLPDFILGGAPKCGTTSLFDYLAQHPGLFACAPKEPHYFATAALDRPIMGQALSRQEYEALFAAKAPDQKAGEGSTHYLQHAEAVAPLMKRTVPDVRLVFMLRDPVERVWSHYLFRYAVAGPFDPGGVGSKMSFLDFARHPQVFAAGDYAAKLSVFREAFGEEAMKVLLMDDLKADAGGCLAAVCRHIGVDDGFAFDTSARSNETIYPKRPRLMPVLDRAFVSLYRRLPRPGRLAILARRRQLLFSPNGIKPRMKPSDRAAVRALYAPTIAPLEEMLGRDLSAWKA